MSIYQRDAKISVDLDERRTGYQFDDEVAIPWSLMGEPGRHMPVGFLEEAGYEVTGLDDEAAAMLDWAFALTNCETFVASEGSILHFVDMEKSVVPESRSIALLYEEEIRHIRMFARYGAHLRSMHPERVEAFDKAWAPEANLFNKPRDKPSVSGMHFIFWLNVLFFEEMTIWLDDRLAADAVGGLQPVWKALQAMHRREETQHVVTDEHFLASIQIDPAERAELVQLNTMNKLRYFDTEMGIAGVIRVMATMRPDVKLRRRKRISECAMWKEILTSRHFKRSRRFVPFAELV